MQYGRKKELPVTISPSGSGIPEIKSFTLSRKVYESFTLIRIKVIFSFR